MPRKYKKRVEYNQVTAGLTRGVYAPNGDLIYTSYITPKVYIRELRRETGLSWPKIAHDLRVDSGTDVSDAAVYLWGKGK